MQCREDWERHRSFKVGYTLGFKSKYHLDGRRNTGNPIQGLRSSKREARLEMHTAIGRKRVWTKADTLS